MKVCTRKCCIKTVQTKDIHALSRTQCRRELKMACRLTVPGVCGSQEEIKLDPDRHCVGINQTNPVPADCCGFCFLSNIHIAKLFNCTGMQDILTNDEAIRVLAGQ